MKFFFSTLFAFTSLTAIAQVPLNSVVEHFTNTQCSACASRNPGFKSNVNAHPQVAHLSVHPSAPYAGCALSKQNKIDNDDRTKFYGIFGGTPRIVVNGNIVSGSTSYSVPSIFTPYLGLTTPVSMRIEQTNYGTDSIKAKVVIKKHSATSGDARLFIGLAEDTVFVNGGNGELEHYNVLRKSITGSMPQSVSLAFAIGDSISVTMTGKAQSFWNMNRMFVIAILHEDATTKLLQSAFSRPLKTTSIGSKSQEIKFSVSPNPATDRLDIVVGNDEEFRFKLYNMLGAVMVEGTFRGNTVIKVGDLPSANYLLQLVTKEGRMTQQKVLLQR